MGLFEVNKSKLPSVYEDRLWSGSREVTAFICIDNLNRGPAIGGCRIKTYSSVSEARENVQELAQGMTYKSALAEVPFGGGKAVILADPKEKYRPRTGEPELLKNFARMVNRLQGEYITAEDTGTNTVDMDVLAEHTTHVVGISKHSGNPSPVTAYGVYLGLLACLRHRGIEAIDGLRISLRGAGSVAEYLVYGFPPDDQRYDAFRQKFPGLIHLNPEIIYYHDKDGPRSDAFKKMAIGRGLNKKLQRRDAEDIYITPTDIFIPAAARHSASGEGLERLAQAGCKIIAGPENNQLKDPRNDMKRIQEAGILWAPDYAINAGGLINVSLDHLAQNGGGAYRLEEALAKTEGIGRTIEQILSRAKETRRTTREIANELAEERLRI